MAPGVISMPSPVAQFVPSAELPRHTTKIPVEEQAYQAFLAGLSYLSPADLARVQAAFAYSAEAHQHQRRLSGEPYITHPLAVATSVSEWRMDADAVCAALLHDVIEDTGATKEDLADRFGPAVAELVEGLSKLDKVEFTSQQEAQAENFRKMMLAMARDLRVVLIKLADRAHNIQTMSAVRPEKRRRIARETLEIYAPIANRLGLNKLFRELQDTAFQLIYPHRAAVLDKAMQHANRNRRELFARILESITAQMMESHVGAEVFGREKNLYSIYKKMEDKHLTFSQVLDIYGFRVVVTDTPSCYLAIGALHSLYKPVPGKFKDYIAIPKANGYQSLHTTLIGPYGTPVEVQVRTKEMHHVAQQGVASHWLYKDSVQSAAELHATTHRWLKSLVEIQHGDSSEFLENVKIDLFPDEVYVFTPKGKIFSLPKGATAVDLAYAVHTDIGNCCIAARINHELMPLRTELKSGDMVEIVTAAHANPNPSWLSYVKTGRARGKIRHFLKTMHHDESAVFGERLLKQELLSMGVAPASVPASSWDLLIRASGNKTISEVFTDIGLGKRLASVAARRLMAQDEPSFPVTGPAGTLTIRGTEGMAIQLAKCCRPIPGDPIIGSIKKGQGLIVHTHDCPAIRKSRSAEPQKWIEVEWEPAEGMLFDVRIRLEVQNPRGVLGLIAMAIANAGSNIETVFMGEDSERLYTNLNFTIQVSNRGHLATLMRSLRNIPQVARIFRERYDE
jgi:guanosine-3',5'-bis(diphosphate) 3'-pyrophosphohydrolase